MDQRLEIGCLIGNGGFGSVHKGRYGFEEVAIKKIKSTSNGIPFLMEISIMNKPFKVYQNINNGLGVHMKGDEIYLIQPLAISDLRKYLVQNHVTTLKKKIGMCQITKGMLYLHSIGVLHLDIKPSNVLVYNQISPLGFKTKEVCWKLSDFGISRLTGSPLNGTVCTNIYRPPEVWSRISNTSIAPLSFVRKGVMKLLTPSIDYWSLGCTIHHIVYEESIFRQQKSSNYDEKSRRYLLAIQEFAYVVHNTTKKNINVLMDVRSARYPSLRDYISPITKYLDCSNDTLKEKLVSHIIQMLHINPERRSIVGLCSFLNINLNPNTKLNFSLLLKPTMGSIIKQNINRYKEKIKKEVVPGGENAVENPTLIIEWMCNKLSDPKVPKPSNIPLYKLLLAERRILRTLDYYIV